MLDSKLASLGHETTTTTQAGLGEVAELDFPTSKERTERGGVLPRARAVRSAFFQWKKRLSQAATDRFVEVKVAPAMTEPAASAAIEIRLRGNRSLMVAPGFDANHLQGLLAALQSPQRR